MNAEQIREKRRQKILARANAEAKEQSKQSTILTQQQNLNSPKTNQTASTIEQKIQQKQQKPLQSNVQEPQSNTPKIRQHLQTVMNRKRNIQLLIHVSKIVGCLLGLISTNISNNNDWIILTIACFLIITTMRILTPESQFEKSKAKQTNQSQSQLTMMAVILEQSMSLLKYLRAIGSIVLCYVIGVFFKVELGMF